MYIMSLRIIFYTVSRNYLWSLVFWAWTLCTYLLDLTLFSAWLVAAHQDS